MTGRSFLPLLILVLLISLVSVGAAPVYAQSAGTPATAAVTAVALAERQGPRLDIGNPLEMPDTVALSMPPIPFRAPQVGPFIKRSYAHDIERRTTAFIPDPVSFQPDFELPTTDEKWIRVDLGDQMVLAYDGTKPVRGFRISSGLPRTPTVTGTFRVRMKVSEQTMTGGDPELGTYYDLPGVKWVQYFHEEYSFHGTYWHNNFGNPMSHGCVNMTNSDAKWLFDRAGPTWDGKTVWQRTTQDEPGTLVVIHQ